MNTLRTALFLALAVLAVVLLLVELLQHYIIATREPERGEWCDLDYDYEKVEPAADCGEQSIDDYLRWLLTK
jgi:hypothetical protein